MIPIDTQHFSEIVISLAPCIDVYVLDRDANLPELANFLQDVWDSIPPASQFIAQRIAQEHDQLGSDGAQPKLTVRRVRRVPRYCSIIRGTTPVSSIPLVFSGLGKFFFELPESDDCPSGLHERKKSYLLTAVVKSEYKDWSRFRDQYLGGQ
ncbi:MAG: hypothetical protein ACF788_04610 [Novipirellula sp. JB048]